jgi:hypothetical protein
MYNVCGVVHAFFDVGGSLENWLTPIRCAFDLLADECVISSTLPSKCHGSCQHGVIKHLLALFSSSASPPPLFLWF